ncbi:MAG: hypothetical protein AB7I50_19375 [Vicinamibacterales bacterium]
MTGGRCIAVGGHSRGIGKTALTVELVRSLGWDRVVTVKVSAHRHGGGVGALIEDFEPSLATSTGRCLMAGARRAFLCRCPDAALHEAVALVESLRRKGWDVVVESNRLAASITPDVTLFVVSDRTEDWKASSAPCVSRADALVLSHGTHVVPARAMSPVGLHRRGQVEVFAFDAAWRVPRLAAWVRTRCATRSSDTVPRAHFEACYTAVDVCATAAPSPS